MSSPKEKKVSKTVSLYPSMWEWLEKEGGGNRSRPIQEHVEASMSSEGNALPNASNENCLVDLAKAYCPARVPQMMEFCDGLNQPIALENILKLIATGQIGLSKNFLLAAEDAPIFNSKKLK